MRQKQPPQSSETSATQQLVVVLHNSKYSYAQFTAFHQTILNIFESSDLSNLNATQMRNALYFIHIVINLLDAPTIQSTETQTLDNDRAEKLLRDVQNLKPRSKNAYALNAKSVKANSDQPNLYKLLGWIDTIVLKRNITIEDMMDQFFLLNLKSGSGKP